MNSHLQSEASTVRLVGSLQIYEAESTRQTLLKALAASPDLCLDLSEVGAVDATGVQLLWATRVAADRAGKRVIFQSVPGLVREHWCALGMPDEFFEYVTTITP